MYSFVEDKRELKEIREVCEQIIKSIQSSWLKEYFTFQFNLIGSGGVKLVTRNGSDGEYDLDYNLIIQKDKKNLFSNPKRIKEIFIEAFNDVNPNFGFKNAENSSSVITSKLVYDNRLYFSFDVAILCEGYNGNYLKITQNKKTSQYYWSEIKSSRNYKSKMNALKKLGVWNEVRNLYLSKKNMHLSRQDEIASFSVLLETLNELSSQYGIEI
jgi:hypothetical protein